MLMDLEEGHQNQQMQLREMGTTLRSCRVTKEAPRLELAIPRLWAHLTAHAPFCSVLALSKEVLPEVALLGERRALALENSQLPLALAPLSELAIPLLWAHLTVHGSGLAFQGVVLPEVALLGELCALALENSQLLLALAPLSAMTERLALVWACRWARPLEHAVSALVNLERPKERVQLVSARLQQLPFGGAPQSHLCRVVRLCALVRQHLHLRSLCQCQPNLAMTRSQRPRMRASSFPL